jgi:hypothetical protein
MTGYAPVSRAATFTGAKPAPPALFCDDPATVTPHRIAPATATAAAAQATATLQRPQTSLDVLTIAAHSQTAV